MKGSGVTLIGVTVIFILLFLTGSLPTSGFISVVNEEERSCIETEVCHDISQYVRLTEGDAFPYEHCICHSELPEFSLVVEVKGPRTLKVGDSAIYTLSINGGPGVSYGFGANASNGTLERRIQFTPQESNTFEIEYTAPAEPQDVTIKFVGLSADGDLESIPTNDSYEGDSWNIHTVSVEIVENLPDNSDDSSNDWFCSGCICYRDAENSKKTR
jgi:hypothetical protein